VKLIRDVATGEAVSWWDPEEGANGGPVAAVGQEVVDVPGHTMATFTAEADEKARAKGAKRAGRIFYRGKGDAAILDPEPYSEPVPIPNIKAVVTKLEGRKKATDILTIADLRAAIAEIEGTQGA
jgi:hypothetical protein